MSSMDRCASKHLAKARAVDFCWSCVLPSLRDMTMLPTLKIAIWLDFLVHGMVK